jgi:anaerobic ribonucleoside-triphosphate reductase activating protein
MTSSTTSAASPTSTTSAASPTSAVSATSPTSAVSATSPTSAVSATSALSATTSAPSTTSAASSVSLLLAKAHYPVTALGPGTRAGLWTQGCTIGCPGCLSRDTWDADPRTVVPVRAVLGWLDSLPGPVDGVTISGGEPFQQPDALAALLHGIDEWRGRGDAEVDVLVYSGYAYSRLTRSARTREILSWCDAVVTGPYVERLGDGGPLMGSANQRLVPLTDLGHRRYADVAATDDSRIQVSIDAGPGGRRVYYIGIPRRGDMDRLNSTLERAGVHAGEVSWRP